MTTNENRLSNQGNTKEKQETMRKKLKVNETETTTEHFVYNFRDV